MIDINVASLATIGLTPYIAQQLLILETHTDAALAARVIEVQREWIGVRTANGDLRARRLPSLDKVATGDWVLVEAHLNNEYWISKRVEPITQITRVTQDGARQLLVTNVDTALLVMGLDQDFNLRRLERYLAIVQAAEVSPVIVLTKRDICADLSQKREAIQQRLPKYLPVITVDAHNADIAIELAEWLRPGQTLVLLGSSGAGKSTLTNRLASSTQKTGAVREGDSKGRHTTTTRSLHQCINGACIIDTPGLRSWSPDLDEGALNIAFDDIDSLAMQCRFRNCQHQDEPGCAVRDSVDPDRLQNYHKLLREIRRSHQTPIERIQERNKWKQRHKEAATRCRQKRQREF